MISETGSSTTPADGLAPAVIVLTVGNFLLQYENPFDGQASSPLKRAFSIA